MQISKTFRVTVFRGNADIKDFPGNYTQYRAWKEEQDALKKQEEQALQSKQAVVEEKSRRPEKEVKRRLTFKERKEFEALDAEIPETAMSSGTLSTEELLAKSARITALIEELDEKTMRWLELSEWA